MKPVFKRHVLDVEALRAAGAPVTPGIQRVEILWKRQLGRKVKLIVNVLGDSSAKRDATFLETWIATKLRETVKLPWWSG